MIRSEMVMRFSVANIRAKSAMSSSRLILSRVLGMAGSLECVPIIHTVGEDVKLRRDG